MNAGDAFKLKIGGAHLWVVLSDPAKNRDSVLLVNVTTYATWQDPTCILRRSDHTFIKHDSCVFYRKCKVQSNAELDAALSRGDIILHQDEFREDVLQRMRDGVIASKFSPNVAKQILIEQGLVVALPPADTMPPPAS